MARMLMARSSASATIRPAFTPGAGTTSNWLTVGPEVMPASAPSTLKVCMRLQQQLAETLQLRLIGFDPARVGWIEEIERRQRVVVVAPALALPAPAGLVRFVAGEQLFLRHVDRLGFRLRRLVERHFASHRGRRRRWRRHHRCRGAFEPLQRVPRQRAERHGRQHDEAGEQAAGGSDRHQGRMGEEAWQPAGEARCRTPLRRRREIARLVDAEQHAENVRHEQDAAGHQHRGALHVESREAVESGESEHQAEQRHAERAAAEALPEHRADGATDRAGEVDRDQRQREERAQHQPRHRAEPPQRNAHAALGRSGAASVTRRS